MTYEQIKGLMPAKRRWCKWDSCIYLQRCKGAIMIRHGYIYKRSRIVATWYPSGKFKFIAECYYTALRLKLNYFMPDGYQIYGHRYYSFLGGPGDEEPRAFYIRSTDRFPNDGKPIGKRWVVITKNGVSTKLGETINEVSLKLRKADIARDMPRRRGRYWLRKARGIYRKPCGKSYRQGCEWRRVWPRPTTNWEGECGCKVYTKKAISRDKVSTIMAEPNATVRTAKIQIYGIEKFFNDAKATTINKEAGYELLQLNTGPAHQEQSNRWGVREQTANVVLTALRMECSTTGKVYVNTVPTEMGTVRAALDWMYNTENYLDRVGVQT